MQQKRIHTLFMGLTLLIIFNLFVTNTTAQQAQISITDFKYQLIRTTPIGTREAYYFNFWITFTNTGESLSPNITAYLEDPELNAKLEINKFSLQPNQNITLIYEDWPTTLIGEFAINITYDPTSPDIEANKYNSGKKQYIISAGTTTTNDTPGFEIALFLLITTLYLLLNDKNKKRN